MIQEQWKEITGSRGSYFASDQGRIKSRANGGNRILKPYTNKQGYLVLGVRYKDERKTMRVHRLVAICFLEKTGPDVNHKNGIKTDNRLENLEWVTKRENQQHAIANGLFKTRTIDMLSLAGEHLRTFISSREAERVMGIHNSTINRCCRGERKTASGYKWAFVESDMSELKKALEGPDPKPGDCGVIIPESLVDDVVEVKRIPGSNQCSIISRR